MSNADIYVSRVPTAPRLNARVAIPDLPGGSVVGGALAGLGQAITGLGQAVARGREEAAVARTTTEGLTRYAALVQRYSADPDYATAPSRFAEEARALERELLANQAFSDLTRARLETTLRRMRLTSQGQIDTQAMGRQHDAVMLDLQQQNLLFHQRYAAAGTDVQRQVIMADWDAAIAGPMQAGVISGEEAFVLTLRRDRMLAEAELMTLIRDEPQAALALLEDPTKYPTLSPVERARYMTGAITADEALEEEERRASIAEIEREGIDLERRNELTTEWLDAHRDDLSPRSYRTFSRLVGDLVAGRAIRTDPALLVQLTDLAESDDPDDREQAVAALQDAYLDEQITKTDYLRLVGRAQRDEAEEDRLLASGRAQVRRYVGNALRPAEDLPRSAHARFLDQMLTFDEWMMANSAASVRDVQDYADGFITAQKRIAALSMILPSAKTFDMFGGVGSPGDSWLDLPASPTEVRPADIERSRALLRKALTGGLISEDRAAFEALRLEDIERTLEQGNGGTR